MAVSLRELITYLVVKLDDAQAEIGKTRLVKFLYLADVEFFRRRRARLTDLEWIFFHYGPYAFAIDTALQELGFDIPSEDVSIAGGRRAIVFRPTAHARRGIEDRIPGSERRVIDRVLYQWQYEELNAILNHVYFYTEPMKNAKRGDLLDFGTIRAPGFVSTQVVRLGLDEERLQGFRARFSASREGHTARRSRPIVPAPRIDAVYNDAVRRLDGEPVVLPPGRLEIPEESKEQLRSLGE